MDETAPMPHEPPPNAASGTPTREPLVFLHVGDLHLTTPDARNADDFRAILDQIAAIAPRHLFDFVYLPGDLAENGWACEYAILADALARHPQLPVRLIPGDHDRQQGAMDDFQAFHAGLVASRALEPPRIWTLDQPPVGSPVETWPTAEIPHYCACEDIRGVRCLFVDIVSPGYGRKGIGLDFRLGPHQTLWLSEALVRAAEDGVPVAVFMHAYPDDLREPDDRADVGGLFWEAGVRLVEMGHTHYNELAHDGRTLYAAARSVGQNEDGSVGYAVSAIDGPVTSWRFKPLDRPWPFVLITSPADRRVATRPTSKRNTGMKGIKRGRIKVRAVVLSEVPPKYVHCRAGTGAWHLMTLVTGRVYEAWLPWPKGASEIQVEAVHPDWKGHGPDLVDTDVIEPVTVFDDPDLALSIPTKPGSDVPRVDAWPEKGVRGDQLGPNRAGRKW
ncbi:3',5'-cyclic adenosine monophosphate phosphodiesterase CpdA [Methylobacterium cerastii]|uniref:3',5'-cyclic adenosine monophosphate phosphodiesterase CpdA n=2 Tax=Methylobacterium cerastii TaxID=932741 RepID=A0ABQ4QCZ8_9HYPH|nr:3',5'-cyclic adenosine monophosphate phosphodiesterase CpdA [Methylobacterium cerastii]